jgi:hypothetical protein
VTTLISWCWFTAWAASQVSLPNYRETEIDFGILPLPKYDEQQENYLSLDWGGLMCVPRGADKDLAGYVTELLSYYSMETTVPAWYDIMLTGKIARDDDIVRVLDIIYSNVVYDFGLNYAEGYNTMQNAMYEVVNFKQGDFASFYAAEESRAIDYYNGVCEAILEKYGG